MRMKRKLKKRKRRSKVAATSLKPDVFGKVKNEMVKENFLIYSLKNICKYNCFLYILNSIDLYSISALNFMEGAK